LLKVPIIVKECAPKSSRTAEMGIGSSED